MASDPHDDEVLDKLCRLLFERFPHAEAVGPLLENVRRHPDDAAAHHNLGRVYLELCDYHAAAASLRDAARLRPQDPESGRSSPRHLRHWGRPKTRRRPAAKRDRAHRRQLPPDMPGDSCQDGIDGRRAAGGDS